MYVFCVGMYRSCSTWQYEVACHLLERHRGAERLGFLPGDPFADHAASEAEPGRWYVLKAHDADPRFGSALQERRALGLYSYRDLRDVCYSLIHKYQADFDEIVARRRFLHTILDNDRYWTAQPHLLCQRYESLIADSTGGVKEIATHLGVSLAEGEAAAIAAEYSLEANQRRTAELTRRLGEQGIDLNDSGHALLYDPHSLLHWNHLRQGRAGGWREDATPAQRATLAEICGAWLIDRGYEPSTDWAVPPEGLRARIDGQDRALAELEARLAEARTELASTRSRLDSFEAMGPLALGIARKVHRLSRGLAGPHSRRRGQDSRRGAGASGTDPT